MEWNDFVNELLLKGQVKEIKIYPGEVKATLRRGATYKGMYVLGDITIGRMSNIKNVEESVRTIEKHIGIRLGILNIFIYLGLLNIFIKYN